MFLDLFPCKVYRNTYADAHKLKDTLFSKLDAVFRDTQTNNNQFMENGTLCSYHVEADIHKKFAQETQSVVEFIESCAKEYWLENQYYQELQPFVLQMWANSTPKGGSISSHLHGSIPFTGVLYIDASPEQGNLVLENPNDTLLMSQPINPNAQSLMEYEVEVNTGDLILFPGWMKHRVKPNTSETPRLILGFNIGSKGKYWTSQWVNNNV